MDISDTIQPKSDQLNYDDFIAGPMTLTVKEARVVGGDQPVHIVTEEFPGRPYKPSKGMRRILVAAWGPESATYAGKRLTLYGDPDVTWAGAAVGGIRISHLSHIDKVLDLPVTEKKGKRTITKIKPLPAAADPLAPHIAAINAAATLPSLQDAWEAAKRARVAGAPQLIAVKDARKAALTEPETAPTTEGAPA